jgi:hypothetical protein
LILNYYFFILPIKPGSLGLSKLNEIGTASWWLESKKVTPLILKPLIECAEISDTTATPTNLPKIKAKSEAVAVANQTTGAKEENQNLPKNISYTTSTKLPKIKDKSVAVADQTTGSQVENQNPLRGAANDETKTENALPPITSVQPGDISQSFSVKKFRNKIQGR